MPERDLTVRLRAEGGQGARNELGQFKKGIGDLGGEGERAGTRVTAGIGSMLAGFASVGAAIGVVRGMYRSWAQDMERGSEAFRRQQRAILDAMMLGRNVEDRGFLGRVQGLAREAKLGRGGVAEAGAGIATIESMGLKIAPELQKALVGEAAQQRRITTMPLPEILETYARLGSFGQAGGFGGMGAGKRANLIQNVSAQFVEAMAERDPRMAAQILPKALALSERAGLGHQQMAGLLAEATQVASPEMAATGVEALVRRAMGAQGAKLGLKGTLFERIGQMGKMGDVPLAQFLGESGERLMPMIRGWGAARGRIGEFVAATAPERDIVGEKLRIAGERQPGFVEEEHLRSLELREEIAEAGLGSQGYTSRSKWLSTKMKEAGIDAWTRGAVETAHSVGSFVGGPLLQKVADAVEGNRSSLRDGAAEGSREVHRQEVE